MSEMGEEAGIVLSDANTREAACQLLEKEERARGGIREGMLLIIGADEGKRKILARVGEIIPYHAFLTEGSPFSEAIRKKLRVENYYRIFDLRAFNKISQVSLCLCSAPSS